MPGIRKTARGARQPGTLLSRVNSAYNFKKVINEEHGVSPSIVTLERVTCTTYNTDCHGFVVIIVESTNLIYEITSYCYAVLEETVYQ